MTVNGVKIDPVESVGTKVTSGVSDEGDIYTGGLMDNLNGYTAETYASIANSLNGYFSAYPIDIESIYNLDAGALKTWTYDSENNLVTFADTYGTVTYVQPDCENVEETVYNLQDGKWYGRSNDTVVKITVENQEITATEVISGEESGEDYDAALELAQEKSAYGDNSHYYAADTSQFAGGSGTQEDPYLISNEEQLRYLSYSVNEDVDWSGVYFKQTADISLSGEDWQPIGRSIQAEINGSMTTYASYPFRGNYDGDDYTISGLTIGTADDPSDQMATGLFGFVAGAYSGNDAPDGSEQTVTLENIHLENVDINVSVRYQNYVGGLLGMGQNGVYIDNCSVTGTIDAETSESFGRVGGLTGSILRGAVTNCWTNVTIYASTDASSVYAGGLFGLTNRATILNCYALGDVTGSSTSSNKVYVGGLTGQAGGLQINCYAAGDVISNTATINIGGINGRTAGIAADYNCYYSIDAVQKQGNTTNSENVATTAEAIVTTFNEVTKGKTAAELASEEFAALLNENITETTLSTTMELMEAFVEEKAASNSVQYIYYTGNTLSSWELVDGIVTFAAQDAGGTDAPGTDDPGTDDPDDNIGTEDNTGTTDSDNNTGMDNSDSSNADTTTTYTDSTNTYALNVSSDGKATAAVTKVTDTSKTSVTIPSEVKVDGTTYAVTQINASAYANCTKLKSVTIPSTITTIGDKAFYNCTSLKMVKGLSGVQTIGNSAFQGCKSMKKVSITSKVLTKIGNSAFKGCTSMTSFSSSSTKLTSIGKKAFFKASRLKKVTFKTTKLKNSNVGKKAFKGIRSTCTFKVPKSKINAYKKLFKARGASAKIKVKK